MLNRRARAIIRREYVQRVRSRWFLFTTIFVPLLMGGAILLPALLLEDEEGGDILRVGILDHAEGRAALRLAETLHTQQMDGIPLPAGRDLSNRELAAHLEAEDFDLYLLVPPDVLESHAVTIFTLGSLGMSARSRLETAVHEAILISELSARGVTSVDVEELLRGAELEVQDLREGRGGSEEAYQVLGFTMAMILYMMFLVYGQMITRGVQEEKTSDIVEIMVSSVRPREMMLGKIVGVGGVGLTQVAIWALMLAAFALYALAGAGPALARLGIDLAGFRFPIGLAVMALVYFVLGYLLYAGLFAAAGAMLGSEQDIQQVMLPFVIPLVIPVMILPGVIDNPDAAWAVTVSLVPFFSPILMLVRLTVGNVDARQVAASVALLIASVFGAAWLAGRIYRVGILMKGKRPNVPELVRWIRYG
ncbi:MAG: ABC transporter permease [Gemmatimonadota bacterium]